jgi:hypothetical protein
MNMFTELSYDFCSHTKSIVVSNAHEHDHETFVWLLFTYEIDSQDFRRLVWTLFLSWVDHTKQQQTKRTHCVQHTMHQTPNKAQPTEHKAQA